MLCRSQLSVAFIPILIGFGAVFYSFWSVVNSTPENPVQSGFQKEIVGIIHDVQEIAPLIYFEDSYGNRYLKDYRKLTANAFDDMLDELDWLSKQMVKNNDDAQKFFELTLTTRYTETAWKWLGNENFVDTERYLKSAKEHLQKAKEVHQLQERRKGDVQ